MNDIVIQGGDSTSTSRTSTLKFTTYATLSKITVPFTLDDSTSYTKSVTVTVTVDSEKYTATKSYETTSTGSREIGVSIGREITGNVTVKFSGTKAYCKYGTYSEQLVCYGEMLVYTPYQMTISYDVEDLWQTSDDNDGYPYIIGYPPDVTEFAGYEDPKPLNSWKIDANNDGYPWTWGFETTSNSNIFLKTNDGLVSQTVYFKTKDGLIPISLAKQL